MSSTQEQLQKIAEGLKHLKPGSKGWKKLQAQLDLLCGTHTVDEDSGRSRSLEADWEEIHANHD